MCIRPSSRSSTTSTTCVAAVAEMRVAYPVAIDNDFAIWRALNNQYWPSLYVVDAQGRIRHHQFGEGSYEQSERIIQQLLIEAGNSGVGRDLATVVDAPRPRGPRRLGRLEVA